MSLPRQKPTHQKSERSDQEIYEDEILTFVYQQTLTICYHITHQQINIRKETSTSINVFSIASFITMASLLALLYHQCPQPTFRCEAFPEPPVVSHGRGLWHRFQYAAAVAAAGGAEDGRIEL